MYHSFEISLEVPVHVAQFLSNLLFTDANNRMKTGKAPKMDIIRVTEHIKKFGALIMPDMN